LPVGAGNDEEMSDQVGHDGGGAGNDEGSADGNDGEG